MWKRIVLSGVVLIGLTVIVAGCDSSAGTGAGIGGLGGAGLGAIIGHQTGHTTEGALIGGALGAGTGYIIGNEADKKKEQTQQTQIQAQNQAAIQAVSQEANTQIVNVHNSNGSVTPIRIVRQGTVYIGPRGEQYLALPTEEQLKQGGYGL
jgi:outer membrane lipoprotein SlyB